MNEVDNEVVNEVANSTLSENTDVILNEITIVPDKIDSSIEEPATSEDGLPLAESEPEDAAPVAASKKVYLLECKTGHVDLDDVKRLEQLVKQHAETKGIETLGILVSLKPIPTDGVVEKHIKSSACLACFYGDNIPTRMKNLLTTQPKCVLR